MTLGSHLCLQALETVDFTTSGGDKRAERLLESSSKHHVTTITRQPLEDALRRQIEVDAYLVQSPMP